MKKIVFAFIILLSCLFPIFADSSKNIDVENLDTKKLKIIKKIIEEYNKYFDCFLTSRFTLEVVKSGVNKGSAVKKLTEHLNLMPQNVAAIGDYYNDVKMLESVAHPVCCGQAPDDIKSICEHVTCHCNDGAVCEFINYIEQNYIV